MSESRPPFNKHVHHASSLSFGENHRTYFAVVYLGLLKRSAASEARVISSERGVTSSARNAISSTN